MARLKRHPLRNTPPVFSDDEIGDSAAAGDNATDGGAEPHSPARSLSDSDIEGTPPSPSVSGFIIQPIRPAMAGEDSVVKPKRSSARSGSKWLSQQDGGEEKMKKKKKKKKKLSPKPVADGGDEEIKKSSGAIQRLWSEEDEIAILKGVIEFRAKTGSDLSTDAGGFLEFVKDSIHVDASKSQLMSKVNKLKRKFRVKSEKCEKGEDPVFNNSHESTTFELSKKIWGQAESNEETMIHNNETGSRKRAKKARSDENTPGSVVPETVSEKPLTLGSRKQDANAKKNRQVANLESENGDGVEPAKRRGDFEDLADAAVAVAAAEANLNPEVLDDTIDMVAEKDYNGKENSGSDEAVDEEIEMAVEKGYDGKENSDNDEAVDDEIDMVVESGCDAKENGEAVDGEFEMFMEKGCDGKENGGSDETVEKGCHGKEKGGSGEAKSNTEVADGRIEMIIDKVCDEKENGWSGDAGDAVWARYPYLQDALETAVAQGMVGELQKRLLLGKVGAFEGEKGKAWNDQWKAYRYEEMLLQIKKHSLMAAFSQAALDELNE